MKHKIFWGSSYDRGIDNLLNMWGKVVEKYPDAELHIAYGWNLFDAAYADNPERQGWKARINKLMEQKGITHHGRLGKKDLKELREECTIWAYPTWFQEINCITALECQNDGVVPVTMDDFALSETVQSGIKIKGDIYDEETQEEYVNQLLNLMGDDKKWAEEEKKGKAFAKDFGWYNISKKWIDVIKA